MFQSVFLIVQNCDLGLRYGLGNRLAALTALTPAQCRLQGYRAYLATGNFLLVFATVTAGVAWLFAGTLPWTRWFSMHSSPLADITPALMAKVLALTLLSLPGNLVSTVLFANHEITAASAVTVLNAAVVLGALYIGVHFQSFEVAVLAYFGSNLIFSIGATLWLWHWRRWRWRWTAFSRQWRIVSGFLVPSLKFFGLNLAATLTGVIGTFVSGSVFGLVLAGHFSVIQRIFSLLNTVHLAVLSPMGPEYSRLARSGAWQQIQSAHVKSLKRLWPVIFIGGGGILWVGHPYVLYLWTGMHISDYSIAGALWLWVIVQGWINSHSVVLNSLGIVGFQGVYTMVMITPSILTPYFLSKYFGTLGIVFGLIVCQLPAVVIWWVMLRRVIDRKICVI